jgi:hypothetical protein
MCDGEISERFTRFVTFDDHRTHVAISRLLLLRVACGTDGQQRLL